MQNNINTIKFVESAFNSIVDTIGSNKAETGGLLFGYEEDYIVRKIVFDRLAKTTKSSYTFNTDFLNPEVKRLWETENLSCIGFIHSHPNGYSKPSSADISYFMSMFKYMPRKHYIIPIVFTVPDGGFKVNCYTLPNGSSIPTKTNIELIPDDYVTDNYPEVKETKPTIETIQHKPVSEKIKLTFEEICYKTDDMLYRLARLIFIYGSIWYVFKTANLIINKFLLQ